MLVKYKPRLLLLRFTSLELQNHISNFFTFVDFADYLSRMVMDISIEPMRYNSKCITFTDWISLITLCLAPLIAVRYPH